MNPDDGYITIFSGGKRLSGVDSSYKKTTRKGKRETHHPIFDKLKVHTTDSFWLDFLTKAKLGNLPKNYRFTENYLIYKYRNKMRSMVLDEPSAEKFKELKKFLYDNTSIQSPLETEKMELENIEVPPEPLSFNKIRNVSAHLKVALANYIDKFVRKYNFTHNDIIAFESALRFYISSEIISAQDVVLKNNLIEDIACIKFDENSREIFFDINVNLKNFRKSDFDDSPVTLTYTQTTSSDSSYIRESKRKVKPFIKEWELYLEKLFLDKKKE